MMMGAALAQGDSVVTRVLESKDLERTMDILRGAGAGIAYLLTGDYKTVAHTIVNALAIVSGIVRT